jgi:hypothetical protein
LHRETEKLLVATLLASGLALTLYSYFALANVPLTALGIGILVTAASINATYPYTPYGEAVQSVLYSYTANISKLLEEFSANNPAFYTPDGLVLVPLKARGMPDLKKLKSENLVYSDPSGYYLVLQSPVSTTTVERETELEATLTEVVVYSLGLSDSVKVVSRDETLILELSKPRSFKEGTRFKNVLGPLPLHVSAAVTATALGKVVQVGEVRQTGKNRVIALLKVVEHATQG